MTQRINIADRLGLIKAEIAKLQAEERKLKGKIELGTTEYGSIYQATAFNVERDVVDWKAVALYLKPSHQLLAAHTEHRAVRQVKVTEIKEEAA